MSKTKPVALGGVWMWAYDASLSLVLAETVRLVEGSLPDRRPAWWSRVERELRQQAVVGDVQFDLELGLDDDEREELARLFDEAAELVRERGVFTADEADAWPILDGFPVIFRGEEPRQTGPAAELGHALAQLIRGTLPVPPQGTVWYYGPPSGQTMLELAHDRESGTQ
ncbi:hypothetical protein ACFVWG_19160 [Kribbella sp. NPDC058245]|uniref:hypothetical protein n=1 Tax=Kribbella sp. NPDC058245 TaxID=3346399 RepID=UPI0036E68C7F